ncbi:spore coat protein U domain-containing protein [Polaromonas glacialis]|uniref:spore coat protein U domain-containing protein n=1 Tax=Polaromonas glacialis TaxID=866564 RepID=UPI000A01A503|nr:spore coat protein U domain-containing protein [Polaromonas glacialis]
MPRRNSPRSTTPARLGWCFFFAPLLLGAATPAYAADSSTVSVGATVLSNNNCKFRAPGSATLAFGNIDPSSNINATASATLTIRCGGASPLVSYALSHDSGLYKTGVNLNRMKHATLNEYLPYALTLTPSSGTIAKNADQTITLSSSVTPASFQNAAMGAYADTVVITLSP